MNIEVPEDFVFVCDEANDDRIKASEIFEIYSDERIYLYPKSVMTSEVVIICATLDEFHPHSTNKPAISVKKSSGAPTSPETRLVRRGNKDFDEVLREVYLAYIMR